MSEERKADVTVAELQDNGCLTGDCPHGSASDCLDHLTLMIGMLRDSDGEEDAGPRADLPPDVVTRIQNFLDGHPADDTIIKLADAKGRPFTHVTAGWLRSILDTHPSPVTEAAHEVRYAAPASELKAVAWQYRVRRSGEAHWVAGDDLGDGWITAQSEARRNYLAAFYAADCLHHVETRDLFTHPAPATVTEDAQLAIEDAMAERIIAKAGLDTNDCDADSSDAADHIASGIRQMRDRLEEAAAPATVTEAMSKVLANHGSNGKAPETMTEEEFYERRGMEAMEQAITAALGGAR